MKIKLSRLLMASFIIISLLLNTGCGFFAGVLGVVGVGDINNKLSVEKTDNNVYVKTTLNPNTKVINDEGSIKPKDIKEIKEDTLIFSKTLEKRNISEGDILIGNKDGNSFLKKVVAITQDSDNIIVKTEQASLVEAFDELHISGLKKEWLQTQGLHTFDSENEKKIERNIPFETGLELETTIIPDLDYSDTTFQLDIFHWKGSARQVTLRVAPRLNLYFKSILKAKTAINFVHKEFSPIELIPIPISFNFWVSGIKITLNFTISINLEFNGYTEGSASFGGVETENTWLKMGFELTNIDNKGFNGIFDKEIHLKKVAPEAEAKASLEAKLYIPQIKFDFKLCDIAGPYVEMGPYIKTELYVDKTFTIPDCSMNIGTTTDFGLDATGGLEASLKIPFLDKLGIPEIGGKVELTPINLIPLYNIYKDEICIPNKPKYGSAELEVD